MNSRFFVILIVLIILIGLSAAGAFVYRNRNETKETPPAVEKEQKTEIGSEEVTKVAEETILIKDGFDIVLPAGWQEILDFPDVLAMVVDAREEITDEKIKNIGFRTNFSIKNDDLGKYNRAYTVEDYAKSIETTLVQLIPGIEFANEKLGTINGKNAFFVEGESTQEEVDFKTLLVFIEGNDNIIWAISFNTFQNSWTAYRDLFYRIAESFKLKYEFRF